MANIGAAVCDKELLVFLRRRPTVLIDFWYRHAIFGCKAYRLKNIHERLVRCAGNGSDRIGIENFLKEFFGKRHVCGCAINGVFV